MPGACASAWLGTPRTRAAMRSMRIPDGPSETACYAWRLGTSGSRRSRPKQQAYKQAQPNPRQKMPVQRRRGGAAPLTPEIEQNHLRPPGSRDQQTEQRQHAPQQVDAVRTRQHVKQRAVRIVPEIDSLRGQLPQREQLRRQECGARDFKRPRAREDQASAQPQQMGRLNVLPMPERLRTLVVGQADGHEKDRNRNQQEAHGQQAGAWNAPAIVAVIAATAARVVRAMIARAASMRAAKLDFRSFQDGRHTFKIPARGITEECLKSAGDSLAAPSSFWARSGTRCGALPVRESTRLCTRPCRSIRSQPRSPWPARPRRPRTLEPSGNATPHRPW